MTNSILSRLQVDVPLGRRTHIRVGGSAAFLARPTTVHELQEVVGWAAERGLPVAPLGRGAKVLVADAGVHAMVLQVVGEMRQITFLADDRLLVGAGVSNVVLAHRALDHGLSGMEFAEGIPGTVGASVRLNAGAYDQSFGDSLLRALVVSPRGAGWRERDEINPTYRDTNLQATEVVAQIEVQLTRNSREKIASRMQELADRRARTQPIKARTFGSVFVNPGEELGDPALPPAWKLIADCGLRDEMRGGAKFSPTHTNFIENVHEATAADVVELIALARQRVHAESGIVLKPEIVFFGDIGLPPIR